MGILARFFPPRSAPTGNPAAARKGFTFFSDYDATKPKNRRAAPSGLVRSEDASLPPSARRSLVSGSRELHRNFSAVGWAIRRHLDYVATFSFRSKTGNPDLDAKINAAIETASRKENFDVAGRHSLARSLRMSEARRVVDGDIFWLKLASGQTQIIEGDRIRTPYAGLPGGIDPGRINHGVYTSNAGRPVAYVLCKRATTSDAGFSGGDMTYDRMLQAAYVFHHGCWDTTNRFDQVRGISPLSSAHNAFRDVYENLDHAAVKAKVAQLFALAIMRTAAPEEVGLGVTGAPVADGTIDNPPAAPCDRYPDVNFGNGPIKLELEAGDEAKIIESQTPSTEFQAFVPLVLQIALKSLDIPYSFFDESHTNYSGQRQGWILYEKSARSKRRENRELLDDWTAWRLAIMVDDGELELPPGMTVADLKWAWKPAGTPWIDPLKEALADIAGMEAGIESPQGIADRTGERDPFDIIEEQAAYLKARRAAGLPDPKWIIPTPTGGTGTTATPHAASDESADRSETGTSARDNATIYLQSLPPELELTK